MTANMRLFVFLLTSLCLLMVCNRREPEEYTLEELMPGHVTPPPRPLQTMPTMFEIGIMKPAATQPVQPDASN
jgi:hypothetical protein